MTPAEAAREVALDFFCAGTPEMDRIARAFEQFARLLDEAASPEFESRGNQ